MGLFRRRKNFIRFFLQKWHEYLYKIKSGRRLRQVLGKDFETTQDVKDHLEEIKIHLRGHNLYDIFYGRYKKQEKELLTKYVEIAPREDFKDILDSIDSFIYFESRKRT